MLSITLIIYRVLDMFLLFSIDYKIFDSTIFISKLNHSETSGTSVQTAFLDARHTKSIKNIVDYRIFYLTNNRMIILYINRFVLLTSFLMHILIIKYLNK